MRGRIVLLVPGMLAAALFAALLAVPAAAQQLPIFGCRHAVSCRTPPIGLSALNDPGAGGLLVSGVARWSPGASFGLAHPLTVPTPEAPEPAEPGSGFHLRGVRLLPTPADESAPEAAAPAPTPTPAAPRSPVPDRRS